MLKRILINFALKVLRMEVINKIEYGPAKGVTDVAFQTLERSANIVLDSDPDNKAQFAAMWKEQKKPLLLGALDTTRAIVIEETEGPTETYVVALIDEIRTEVEKGNILKIAA